MKHFLAVLLAGMVSSSAFAFEMESSASPLSTQKAIKALSGCYEVTFQFTETFTTDPNAAVRSKPYLEHGLEWIDLDLDTQNEIHLQHVLMTPNGPLKHWREEWEFEAKDLLTFKGDQTWTLNALTAKGTAGKWTQRVYQVDDSPRYECAAPWIIWSGAGQKKRYWECDAAAPLPRREFTQRTDYDVLSRRNRHELNSEGFVHEQDNRKLAKGIEIAQEKGRDTYKRVDPARCKEGALWWSENKGIWHEIQAVWRGIRTEKPELKLASKVNGQILFMALFELADRYTALQKKSGAVDAKALKKDAEALIRSYIL